MIFLEGAQFTACPFYLCFYKIAFQNDKKQHIELDLIWTNPYTVFVFLFWLFRQSLVSAAVGFHCTDVKGKRFSGWIRSVRGRFCPKRQSRLTFSLSIESVLTSMDEWGNMRLAVNYYMALQMLFSISPNLSESCSKSWLIFWAVIFA